MIEAKKVKGPLLPRAFCFLIGFFYFEKVDLPGVVSSFEWIRF
jgi:hypothetical protein